MAWLVMQPVVRMDIICAYHHVIDITIDASSKVHALNPLNIVAHNMRYACKVVVMLKAIARSQTKNRKSSSH
jgi:hypothetical protein